MKRIITSLMFFSAALACFSQKGFGIDGSLCAGYKDGGQTYALMLDGRIQFSDYFSADIGLGLWNSGWQNKWKYDDAGSDNSTLFRLSDTQTVPGMQLGIKGQVPLFNIIDHKVSLFAEPKLYFMPFTGRTASLNEIYFKRTIDQATGETIYTETGQTAKTSLKSDSSPFLFGGFNGGLSVEMADNVDLAISYGYSNIDLFKNLRGLDIKGYSLDDHGLPGTGLQMVSISVIVHYDLN